MSVKLDPKEVLQYLNELGYYNINAQQLKEFMKGKNIFISPPNLKFIQIINDRMTKTYNNLCLQI